VCRNILTDGILAGFQHGQRASKVVSISKYVVDVWSKLRVMDTVLVLYVFFLSQAPAGKEIGQ
jgi:hypothetical protein